MKKLNNSRLTLLFFITAAFLALASRWLPHPDNFSALGGVIFLGGFLAQRSRGVLLASFLTLLVSDLLIGFYSGIEWVYLGYLTIFAIGHFSRSASEGAYLSLGLANSLSAVSFFILSNFGVWFSSGLYEKSAQGLLNCYLMGLPFFHMTFLSQLLVGTALCIGYNFFEKSVLVQSRI